ncbi:hypothetical protein CUMW_119000 [Citrus unshiu]|nr:hypothetical protein CUMW_119000 [Citrus unshiu]
MAKSVLQTYDNMSSYRPNMAVDKYTGYNFSNITWSSYGPYFGQAPKMCSMELFSAKRLKSYEYTRVEELKLLLKYLYESSGKPIVLKDHLADVSLNIISRVEFKEMANEFVALNGVIRDSIPWIRFSDLVGNMRRMKTVAKKFDMFLEHAIDKHNVRRKGENYVTSDMVDVLLELADAPNLEVKLEREGVKGFIVDLVEGATETKATEELERVIGKDAQVLVNTWSIETDPALWESRNEFFPKIFLGKSINVEGNDFEFLPFGAGRRMCPGYSDGLNHGLKVIQSSLANLLHRFTWKLPGNMSNNLSMEEVFKLANQKKFPLEVVAQLEVAKKSVRSGSRPDSAHTVWILPGPY